jgi:pimeloyl-ACP methyl ester carboxylesterase
MSQVGDSENTTGTSREQSAIELGGPGLGDVDTPVLIVNGAADFPYVDTRQDLASAIPGARLVTIPGQDHLGTVTDPLFKDEVLAFLEGCRHE